MHQRKSGTICYLFCSTGGGDHGILLPVFHPQLPYDPCTSGKTQWTVCHKLYQRISVSAAPAADHISAEPDRMYFKQHFLGRISAVLVTLHNWHEFSILYACRILLYAHRSCSCRCCLLFCRTFSLYCHQIDCHTDRFFHVLWHENPWRSGQHYIDRNKRCGTFTFCVSAKSCIPELVHEQWFYCSGSDQYAGRHADRSVLHSSRGILYSCLCILSEAAIGMYRWCGCFWLAVPLFSLDAFTGWRIWSFLPSFQPALW